MRRRASGRTEGRSRRRGRSARARTSAGPSRRRPAGASSHVRSHSEGDEPEQERTHLEAGALEVALERLTDLPDEVARREQDERAQARDDPVLQRLYDAAIMSSANVRARAHGALRRTKRTQTHLNDRDDVAQRLAATGRRRDAHVAWRVEGRVQRWWGCRGGEEEGEDGGLDCEERRAAGARQRQGSPQ